MPETILAVIPCLDEERHLVRLVMNLLRQTETLPLRIIIVDGGSRDRSRDIACHLAGQDSRVCLLENPKKLQAAAINLAVATYGADAEYLIRVDAHADYPDNFCRILVDEACATGADAVVVAMKTEGKQGFQKAVAAAQNSKLGNGGSAHRLVGGEGRWVDHGHHALIRIAAFRAIGGYDESFSHNEDAEFDTRLTIAGRRIWLTGKTSLVYYPRASPWSLFFQYMKYGQGRARNIFKHRTMPKLRQMAPALVLPAVLLALLTPAWSPAISPLLAWILVCVGYGLKLGHMSGDRRLAMAGPAAMIMHAGWSLGFWLAALKHFREGR